jgi:hypothetical protein
LATFEYLIWYRVERADHDSERAIRGMMARLGCRTGIRGRLMKKRGEDALWLESYAGVRDPDAFEQRLRQAIDEFDIEMFIDGPRHTECFIDSGIIQAACEAP